MPHEGNRNHQARPSFLSELDFGIEICRAKNEGRGEDSYLFLFTQQDGIAGVFDGCGGSGAKRYEKYGNRTGAYMASRVTAGAARDWFLDPNAERSSAGFKEKAREYLSICNRVGGGKTSFKGSMIKDFPTTAAFILSSTEGDKVSATCMWAGDSRCYLLDENGLKQLTDDDLNGFDAMQNLSADGALTNVITATRDFSVHERQIRVKKPAILFSATDGCFGYISTPMEFEQLLLSSLQASESVREWEKRMSDVLTEVAGDDYTMVGMSFGFGSFSNLKHMLAGRCRYLFEHYTRDIREKTIEEKTELWKAYMPTYYFRDNENNGGASS